MYQVTIIWFDGTTPLRALVTKKTLQGFKLTAVKGAAVKIVKVRA
jgi:hypothetical protein